MTLALTLAVACSSSDSVVVITVQAGTATLSATHLRLALSNGATTDTRLFPEAGDASAGPLTFPATLALILPRARAGTLDVAVDALDGTGASVGHASASKPIAVGGKTHLAVTLAAGWSLCGNAASDPGEQCDDGNRFSGDGCSFICQREIPPDAGTSADGPALANRDGKPADASTTPSVPATDAATAADRMASPNPDAGDGAVSSVARTQPNGAPCSSGIECLSGRCSGSPGICAPNTLCPTDSGVCFACGQAGAVCCPGNLCSDGSCCVNLGANRVCTAVGTACGSSGATCQATGSCGGCGGLQEPCCAGNACTRTGLGCVGGRCISCGAAGQPCCTPGGAWACQPDLLCDSGTSTCRTATAPTPPNTGLIAHWKLDDNTGAVASDSSGNGNHGAIQGTPVWIPGNAGSALRLDHVTSRITVPNAASLQPRGTSLTIQMWLRPTVNVPYARWALNKQEPNAGFALYFATTGAAASLCAGAPRIFCASAVFPVGIWRHLAVVLSAGTLTLYADGVPLGWDGGYPTTLVPSASPVVIGAYPFSADLDDIRIYSVARTPAELCTDAARTWSAGACR